MNLSKIDYRARMTRAASELTGGALLLVSQPTAQRNSSVDHHYRQESFLHYLTGFEEPEAALLIAPVRDEGDRYHLFVRERDAERELWDGRRLGLEGARRDIPVDHVHPIAKLWDMAPDLLAASPRLYFPLGLSESYDRRLIQTLAVHKGRYGKKHLSARIPIYDAFEIAGRLRLHKGPEEVERMRGAAAISAKAYERVYREVRPGMTEKTVHGILVGEFLANGGDMEAYGSIVAGGENACILHYHENCDVLRDGELLLIDAGAQFEYYASDVTRTFPIGRKFTPAQRACYDVVLAAQLAAIAKAMPGSSLVAMHEAMAEVLLDGLIDLKLLKGSRDELKASNAVRKYMPHGLSHWIGMDVHDVGVYYDPPGADAIPLAPGMYFSVEPGIYVPKGDDSAPAELRGVGIRIEDDVLVTKGAPDVITGAITKDAAKLENRY